MSLPAFLPVAIGGAGGALARWWTTRALTGVGGWDAAWSTALVNVAGAFALGLAASLLAERVADGQQSALALLLMVGFLGAFTTFSTFAMDAVWLLRERGVGLAALYIAASVGVALLAFLGGALLGARA